MDFYKMKNSDSVIISILFLFFSHSLIFLKEFIVIFKHKYTLILYAKFLNIKDCTFGHC